MKKALRTPNSTATHLAANWAIPTGKSGKSFIKATPARFKQNSKFWVPVFLLAVNGIAIKVRCTNSGCCLQIS